MKLWFREKWKWYANKKKRDVIENFKPGMNPSMEFYTWVNNWTKW